MKLNPVELTSNKRKDVEFSLQELRNDVERKLSILEKRLRETGFGSSSVRVDTRLVKGDPGPPGPPSTIPGPQGPPGSLDPFSDDLLPVNDGTQNIGSPTKRINKIYVEDQTIEFETGSLSVRHSQDRPGERGLFFSDSDTNHPDVELAPFRPMQYKDSSQLLYVGEGVYQTPDDFVAESLLVWRHGLRVSRQGLHRFEVLEANRFRFYLTGKVDVHTDVSCSYLIA